MKPLASLAAIAALLALASPASASWVRSWSAAPEPPSTARGPFPASPSFAHQTLRQVVRLSAGGERVRIRLTNEFGAKPLLIGAVHVALADAGGAIQAGTDHVVTFDGRGTAVIAAGAPLLSDTVEMEVPALARLAISLYLPEDTGPCTCHATSMQTLYLADGDQTAAPYVAAAPAPPPPVLPAGAPPLPRFPAPRAFLAGVEVDTPGVASTIVLLGDSITDGVGSTTDQDRRWPDVLAARLAARSDSVWGVANQGISGNRILHDGSAQSALARFDRDVLAVPGARYVVIFEGINDLGRGTPMQGPLAAIFGPPEPVSAEQMISGYRQLILRAHARGLKVIGATIAPYGGAGYFSAEGEAKRQTINGWIRNGGAFDGVIDFDQALRDPADPKQMRADYHAGDHLHGSDAGYKAMGEAIDLGLFVPR